MREKVHKGAVEMSHCILHGWSIKLSCICTVQRWTLLYLPTRTCDSVLWRETLMHLMNLCAVLSSVRGTKSLFEKEKCSNSVFIHADKPYCCLRNRVAGDATSRICCLKIYKSAMAITLIRIRQLFSPFRCSQKPDGSQVRYMSSRLLFFHTQAWSSLCPPPYCAASKMRYTLSIPNTESWLPRPTTETPFGMMDIGPSWRRIRSSKLKS